MGECEIGLAEWYLVVFLDYLMGTWHLLWKVKAGYIQSRRTARLVSDLRPSRWRPSGWTTLNFMALTCKECITFLHFCQHDEPLCILWYIFYTSASIRCWQISEISTFPGSTTWTTFLIIYHVFMTYSWILRSISLYSSFPDCLFGEDRRRKKSGARLSCTIDVQGALHNNTPLLKCATRNVVRRKVKIPPFLSVFLTFYFLHAFIW